MRSNLIVLTNFIIFIHMQIDEATFALGLIIKLMTVLSVQVRALRLLDPHKRVCIR